ncbi:hypothetical protein LPB86_01380 [Pedobacter sp. MC2016-14]|uniref:hypothetical protein n=1 Tax=Pedobacter sp. MC2016-14 TaxID=2897327 RepID=UPI001E55F42B|nr:hypothetical protein [Pedobacter sp. MC2016-14]MCD0486860.1 hypothetical protein [Pedobacter sp. MC2016-14]
MSNNQKVLNIEREDSGEPNVAFRAKSRKVSRRLMTNLKRGIWAYFFLLIFEGALRKWVLPGLATPLLVIRDPIAIWLVITCWNKGLLPSNFYLNAMFWLGVFGFIAAIFVGHGSVPVAIFGARIFMIHFPMIFVIGKIMDRNDVLEMGKALLVISIIMVTLIALQFYSSQSAWVNKGIGGDEGTGFAGAMGFFRPSGTFSFTNGISLFFSLVACFSIYFLLNQKGVNRLILIFSSGAVIASIPLSISRGLFFAIVVSVFFAVIGASRNPKYAGKIIISGIVLFFCIIILSQFTFFNQATEAFTSRFETAGEQEGGLQGTLGDRYLGGMLGALNKSTQQPVFGYGIGMGTSVGSQLLTGKVSYLIAEGEWGRLVGELGAIMGIGAILVRLSFCFNLSVRAYKKLVSGDFLPWILLSFGLVNIPQAQWAQATSLGFSILIGGMIIASLNKPAEDRMLK